ncbi:MAG: exonuclease domain-containing protein [Candidatus Actinomarina sp.]
MSFDFIKPLVVLDIETTGVNPKKDNIIELYMMKIFDNNQIDEYHSKFKIDTNIPFFISELTGIYDWHLKNSPRIQSELKNIKSFLENTITVGHNLNFDLSFLSYTFEKNNIDIKFNEKIDTLKLSRALLRNKIKNHKLSTLSHYFKTKNENKHNAKDDVFTTYEIFQKLLDDKKLKGISNYTQLNNFLNSPETTVKKKFNITDLPSCAGVYLFKNNENYVYIGKSSNLKKRIQSHLSYSRSYKSNKIVLNSNILDVHTCNNELEALIIEKRLINLLQPKFNRIGKKLSTVYWLKLKSNKPNLEISKLEESNNTLFQYGPIVGMNQAQKVREILNLKLNLINCKKNNSRKSPCDISRIYNSACSCIFSFDLDNYVENTKLKLDSYFINFENNFLEFNKNIKEYSSKLMYEAAYNEKKDLDTLKKVNEFIIFYDLIKNNKNQKTKNLVKNFGLEIENDEIKIKNKKTLNEFINYQVFSTTYQQYIQELNLIMHFLASQTNRI